MEDENIVTESTKQRIRGKKKKNSNKNGLISPKHQIDVVTEMFSRCAFANSALNGLLEPSASNIQTPSKIKRPKKTPKASMSPNKSINISSNDANDFTNSPLNGPLLLEPPVSNDQTPPKITRFKNTPKVSSSPNKSINESSNESTDFPNYLDVDVIRHLVELGVIFSSTIRINAKFAKEAYLSIPGIEQDVLIENVVDRNRALEGDEVYAILKPRVGNRTYNGEKQLTCVVVGIKTYNHSRISVGSLAPFANKGFARLLSTDYRMPVVRIPKDCLPPNFYKNPMAYQEILFASKITLWKTVGHAMGGDLEFLGYSGTAEGETNAILRRYDLNVAPYQPELNSLFPSSIPSDAYQSRLDCREDCVVTIDPRTAKDLDDAVSCSVEKDGTIKVGVHIADVSYFIESGTELDKRISERATTVYLVDNVYPMLPGELCSLCSLSPGQDRLCFSVFWRLTPEGEIIDTFFARTVINSAAQLSYEDAQAILDNEETVQPDIYGSHSWEDISSAVRTLWDLAAKLRAKREESGACRIDQIKIGFQLDPVTRTPLGFYKQQQLASHKLIEEFMLLANMSVAEKLHTTLPNLAFLRGHHEPVQRQLSVLRDMLESYGVAIDVSSSKSIQSSILKLEDGSPTEQTQLIVVNNILARRMTRAQYFCGSFRPNEADRRHYALSVPLYTHFTSPIRRYADVMVHRMLSAALGMNTIPSDWTPEHVQSVAEICNRKKYGAKLAGDASSELYYALFIAEQGPILTEAVVFQIGQNSFDCIDTSSGISLKVFYDKIEGKVEVRGDEGRRQAVVQWNDGTQILDMFSVITIKLSKRASGIKLDSTLIKPQFEKTTEIPTDTSFCFL